MKQETYEGEMEDEFSDDVREDSIEEDMETQKEEGELDSGVIPQEQRNILKFLKEILEADDRFKTANLTWEELGKPTFSTRFWLNLANTCEKLFKFEVVALYCRRKAMVTTDTSLSRDGFMIGTSVTQKRVKEKKSSSDLAKFLRDRPKHG